MKSNVISSNKFKTIFFGRRKMKHTDIARECRVILWGGVWVALGAIQTRAGNKKASFRKH